jgi:hypothetical protein
MTGRDFLNILAIGLVVGSATWVLQKVLGNYLFGPLLCNGKLISHCSPATLTTTIVTAILAGVVALTALIRYRAASRPLLAVVAATACLWPVVQRLDLFGSFASVGMVIGLYALTYGLFAWIMRIRSSWVVVAITLVLVAASRLILTS